MDLLDSSKKSRCDAVRMYFVLSVSTMKGWCDCSDDHHLFLARLFISQACPGSIGTHDSVSSVWFRRTLPTQPYGWNGSQHRFQPVRSKHCMLYSKRMDCFRQPMSARRLDGMKWRKGQRSQWMVTPAAVRLNTSDFPLTRQFRLYCVVANPFKTDWFDCIRFERSSGSTE